MVCETENVAGLVKKLKALSKTSASAFYALKNTTKRPESSS
jgi:hypothetical protein